MDNLLPVVLSLCCGIDVHKKTLTACLLKPGASGDALIERRVFKTMTSALQELAKWLACQHHRKSRIVQQKGQALRRIGRIERHISSASL